MVRRAGSRVISDVIKNYVKDLEAKEDQSKSSTTDKSQTEKYLKWRQERREEEEREEKEKKPREEMENKEKEQEIKEPRTTWIRACSPLPWAWDENDSNYIIIKRWVTEDFQEELFLHTKRIQEGKILTQTSQLFLFQTEVKVRRWKRPQHGLRIFT
ncbi:hypothetical protein N7490_011920 [Penicillium lividum]|nr:hypothetical protein N7490_011920 [Penicillium lividum]